MDREGRALGGLALAIGMIASTVVATRALINLKTDKSIQVTGSAKRRITSDLIEWSATVRARGANTAAAYKVVAASSAKVVAYLEKKGIAKKDFVIHAIATQAVHPHDKEGRPIEDQVTAVDMSQDISIRSSNIDAIEQLSREVTELINDGVELQSNPPQYYYTKLGDLKIQMLAEASKDAKTRAEQIATSTGSRVGALRSARMGVIQINPADSTETSNEGNNDTSAKDKDIISVVASTFEVD